MPAFVTIRQTPGSALAPLDGLSLSASAFLVGYAVDGVLVMLDKLIVHVPRLPPIELPPAVAQTAAPQP